METTENLASNIQIMVMWKAEEVDIQVVLKTPQLIHCRVISKDNIFDGYVSIVYAYNRRSGREALWADLLQLKPVIDKS